MPSKPGAVVVGRMACPTRKCGNRIAVYQNVRGYVYTRCPECGTDQRNGAPAQVYFWQHIEALDGAVIERPPNVPESAGPIGGALVGEAPPVTVVEPERKGPVEAQEPTGQQNKQAGKSGPLFLWGVGLMSLAAFGVAVATGGQVRVGQ